MTKPNQVSVAPPRAQSAAFGQPGEVRARDGGRLRYRRLRGESRTWMLVSALLVLLLAAWLVAEASRPLHTLDLDVVRGIAAERTTFLTGIAVALSLAGSVFVILPLAGACCVALYRRGHRASATAVVLSVGGAGLIFNVVKLIVERPRPPVAHLVVATHSSFPSGHATLSAAFYLALALVFLAGTRRGAFAVVSVIATALLVVGIALSRVYLGVHYPSDVVCGATLGAAWALLIALTRRHRRRAAAEPTVLRGVDRPGERSGTVGPVLLTAEKAARVGAPVSMSRLRAHRRAHFDEP